MPPAKRHAKPNKAGFYNGVQPVDDRLVMGRALELADLTQEIALLRTQIRKHVLEMPADSEFLLQALDTLARLLKIQGALTKSADDDTLRSVVEVLEGIGGAIWPEQFTPPGGKQ